jgi:hypothetical protein
MGPTERFLPSYRARQVRFFLLFRRLCIQSSVFTSSLFTSGLLMLVLVCYGQ